ncbi:uncharacterized protein LOC129749393 [Uranotaenia lowii]|uniref:uncharacterized protein LOC129749393 n=1 Tax=Uranotaenia lowii TaxID=190385 RepID=UPI002479F2A4|nr:uncharacterized protein LOC129749393 [Uranotaenia lowii]
MFSAFWLLLFVSFVYTEKSSAGDEDIFSYVIETDDSFHGDERVGMSGQHTGPMTEIFDYGSHSDEAFDSKNSVPSSRPTTAAPTTEATIISMTAKPRVTENVGSSEPRTGRQDTYSRVTDILNRINLNGVQSELLSDANIYLSTFKNNVIFQASQVDDFSKIHGCFYNAGPTADESRNYMIMEFDNCRKTCSVNALTRYKNSLEYLENLIHSCIGSRIVK